MKSPSLFPLTLFLGWGLLLPSILSAPLSVNSVDVENPEAENDMFEEKNRNRNRNRNLSGSNSKHIDFTELLDPDYADANTTDSFLGLVSDALAMLKDYIHDNDDNGSLRINDLLGGLLDEDGYVEFGIEEGFFLDLGGGSTINLTSVSVKGLDTFREADLLRSSAASAIGDTNITNNNNTDNNNNYEPETILQNSFVLETLVLDVFMTETNDQKKESLSIRLPFSGVAVSSMPLLLVLLEEGLRNFPLGAALDHTNRLLPCLKETVVEDASILALEATFEEVGTPSVLAYSNPDSTSPFFGIITTLFVNLPASVPIFFNTTIRALLNDVLNDNLLEVDEENDIKDPCPSYPDMKSLNSASTGENDSQGGLIDFRSFFDKGLPALLMTLLEDQLFATDPDTGLPKINEVLIVPMMETLGDQEIAVDESSGRTSMVFGGSGEEGLVDVNTNIAIGGLDAYVKLRLDNLTLYNLDTMVPPLDLLVPFPQKARQLNNTMTMGLDLDDNAERSMGLSANVFLSILTDDSGDIVHNLSLKANMETISLILAVMLEVVESKLYGFPVKDIMNLQCWLSTLQAPNLINTTGVRLESESFTAGISDLKASLARMNLDVACLGIESEGSEGSECGSLGMEEWIDLIATPEAQIGMTEAMNLVLAKAASLLSGGGAILQTPIDRILNEAPLQCPHSPYYNPDALLPVSYESMEALPEYEYSYEYLILWGTIALALIIAFVGMSIGVKCSVRRKQRRWLASTEISSGQKMHLSQEQQKEDELEEGLNAATNSMFFSREIPALVRWGMPLVVIGNVALFLSGHLNIGANVYIELNLAGETIKVGDFFDFTLARSMVDLWKNGGKSLALLILVFSGLWPYTKQFLTLILWFLPTSRMSISTRGKYFIWLDRLAKWSMIDIFVIVVVIAAFRVSVRSPEVAFLSEDFYSLNLMVVPMWGLYSNMTAQIVSQISSHFIIYYHRRIVTKATKTLQQDSGSEQKAEGDLGYDTRKILLKTHSFSNPHFDSSEKLITKNWVGPFILVSGICMAVLMVIGSVFPSFSVELLGIIGVAVESGQKFEEAIIQHSVWSIVAMLFEEARFLDATGDYIGIGVLGFLLLATVMVVPILQVMGLIYQWFVPLTQKGRRRLAVINEILKAWQYVEVYLIALFVASWQLGPVSQYMFNAYCGSLDGFFADMVSYGILKEADAQCFSVQGSIDPGSIALLVASILLALLNSMITLASNQCLEDYGPPHQIRRTQRSELSDPTATEEQPISAKEASRDSETSGSSHPPNNKDTAETTKIRLFPFMFTDGYQWFLAATASKNGKDNV